MRYLLYAANRRLSLLNIFRTLTLLWGGVGTTRYNINISNRFNLPKSWLPDPSQLEWRLLWIPRAFFPQSVYFVRWEVRIHVLPVPPNKCGALFRLAVPTWLRCAGLHCAQLCSVLFWHPVLCRLLETFTKRSRGLPRYTIKAFDTFPTIWCKFGGLHLFQALTIVNLPIFNLLLNVGLR